MKNLPPPVPFPQGPSAQGHRTGAPQTSREGELRAAALSYEMGVLFGCVVWLCCLVGCVGLGVLFGCVVWLGVLGWVCCLGVLGWVCCLGVLFGYFPVSKRSLLLHQT